MTDVLVIIVLAGLFTAVLAGGQSLYWAYILRKEKERAALARRLGTTNEAEFRSLFKERARDWASQALGSVGENMQKTIDGADAELTVGQVLTRMAAISFAGMAIGGIFFGIPGLVIGILPGVVPYMLLKREANRRAKELTAQLPDALDLMARALQAGLGLNDAMKMCAEELNFPAAGEFGRVFEEVRFGRDYRDALSNLIIRNPDVFDLRLFVSSVLLQRETGGNLIEILETISSTIRQRFVFQARVSAMTAEARLSAIILGSLPIAVGMIISVMNPEYIGELFTDPIGHAMIGLCLLLYACGAFLMRAVSQVEV